METQENPVALPMRPHTILGVCEAIGEDFGFNPVLLRIPFAAGVLWSAGPSAVSPPGVARSSASDSMSFG